MPLFCRLEPLPDPPPELLLDDELLFDELPPEEPLELPPELLLEPLRPPPPLPGLPPVVAAACAVDPPGDNELGLLHAEQAGQLVVEPRQVRLIDVDSRSAVLLDVPLGTIDRKIG